MKVLWDYRPLCGPSPCQARLCLERLGKGCALTISTADVGQRLKLLRERCGLSLRQFGQRAGVTAGMISFIERGRNSPSIATLHKILSALNTDVATFFAEAQQESGAGPVFARENMQDICDKTRCHTIVFPRKRGILLQLFDERVQPVRRRPEYETLTMDVAGYLISGQFVIEIKGERPKTLRPGDAFYIPKGVEHRGYASGGQQARLISAHYPAKY